MRRAQAVLFLAFVIALSLLGCTSACAENLLENGSFEVVDSSGLPAQWYPTAYRSQAGYSRMTVTDEIAYSGKYSACIENASSNDARFTYTVSVKPESLYRLSGYVLVSHMEDTGNGANFGIEGIYSASNGLFDTNGEWQYLEWYGETGEDQTEVTLGVRVGGYSAESVGKAYFDDLVLEEVDALPQEVIASLWYSAAAPAAASAEEKEAGKSTLLFVLLAVVFLVFAYWITRTHITLSSRTTTLCFSLAIAAGLLLRILLAVNIEGYSVDINCFTAWSMRMASVGPAQFYAPDYFCDYPPGMLLLLWPIGLLLNGAGAHQSGLSLLFVKLLPILLDIAASIYLFAYARKRAGNMLAMVVSVLYLFNPAVLVNGSAWGQMDSVLAFMILLTTIAAIQFKWQKAIPLFVASVLIKPQALLFAPVGAAALIDQCCRLSSAERKNLAKNVLTGTGISVLLAFLIVLPFAVQKEQPISWLFTLYGQTLGSYAYATLNTANLHYLVGANWMSLTQQVPGILYLLSAAMLLASAFVMRWKKTAPYFSAAKRKLIGVSGVLSAFAVVLAALWLVKADYGMVGYAMIAFAYVFALILMLHDYKRETLPYFMALALIGVYVIGTKVHERYLFPALLLLLLAYANTKDRRVMIVFAGFSATTFMNTAIVLDNSILFGSAQGHLNVDTLALNQMLCIANLLLYGYAGWIGINGLRQSKAFERKSGKEPVNASVGNPYLQTILSPADHRLHLNAKDGLIIGITTVLYAVLAFSNLGSTLAPQTAWVSTSDKESVVLELEEPATFSVLYYAGVSYNDFSISVSEDGVNWSRNYPCEMREGLCYRWNYALKTSDGNGSITYPSGNPSNVLWLTGKYLKIDACSAGLNLWEIVARDQNGHNLPLKIVSHQNAQAIFWMKTSLLII